MNNSFSPGLRAAQIARKNDAAPKAVPKMTMKMTIKTKSMMRRRVNRARPSGLV